MYECCYEKELRIEAHIRGAEMLFDLLRLYKIKN